MFMSSLARRADEDFGPSGPKASHRAADREPGEICLGERLADDWVWIGN